MGSLVGAPTSAAKASRGSEQLVSLSLVGWAASDEMVLEQWLREGSRLGVRSRASGWWIGDWVNFGSRAYGEKYRRAAGATGYDAQTLMNMAYVASRIEISRRRETLTWSHHAEVAPLSVDEQEQWLDRAARDRLTVRDLRVELRHARREVANARTTEEAPSAHAASDHAVHCPSCGHRFAVGTPARQISR
jgi:hypothetical protein